MADRSRFCRFDCEAEMLRSPDSSVVSSMITRTVFFFLAADVDASADCLPARAEIWAAVRGVRLAIDDSLID